jgi:2-oxoglutarate dehydrogenase E2 component (dihydrolipoamide succinyltransferase)
MSDFEILIPKLGESIQEATITKIFVKKGDSVNEDDVLFEVATDKVDSEIPSPVAGIVKSILCTENDLIAVGKVAMIISLEGSINDVTKEDIQTDSASEPEIKIEGPSQTIAGKEKKQSDRFLSPLVKSIAIKEGISFDELENVGGSGIGGRIQKDDLLKYIEYRKSEGKQASSQPGVAEKVTIQQPAVVKAPVSIGSEDTIIEMDRVRRLIANHMVMSKQVSPHVTTFVEADVTNIVLWRNKIKDEYLSKYGEKLTYLPIFTEAVAQSLAEFKGVNASVDGDKIIYRKHINVGIAVATNSGNLIVPVVKDADSKNLLGLTKEINALAKAGRDEKITADQLQGGTFTITNFGSFGNLAGTPIINQPQVAILAVGTIEKKPAVMETPTGDAIVVRHKMFLSLSYDHRVVDGMMGGKFLRRIADLLEQFDIDRKI